jgi:dihydropteroate synthase
MHNQNTQTAASYGPADGRKLLKTKWLAHGRDLLRADGACSVMAIVNVTPDSFSDGGTAHQVDQALARIDLALTDGADLLDIGGESTRPGATPVSADDEWARVAPVIAAARAKHPLAPISIDTYKPETARRAIELGVDVVNDITGLDPAGKMHDVVAQSTAGIVLMHMQGRPATMQVEPRYNDVTGEILAFFEARIRQAEKCGIDRQRIALDPGIGFGKTLEHNLTILRNLHRFSEFGCAVLIGTSRKRMIGELTGRAVEQRAAGSVASALFAAWLGANVARVHDVAATVDAIKVWNVLEKG